MFQKYIFFMDKDKLKYKLFQFVALKRNNRKFSIASAKQRQEIESDETASRPFHMRSVKRGTVSPIFGWKCYGVCSFGTYSCVLQWNRNDSGKPNGPSIMPYEYT